MKVESVTFINEGQQIVGMFHVPDKTPAPLVILCHGGGANKLGSWTGFFVKAARAFCREGFAVLRFDFIGCGDSDGEYENQTTTSMLSDLKIVIDETGKRKEINNKKIALVGHSQGGYISLLHAAKDKRVRLLVEWMGRAVDIIDFWNKSWNLEIDRKGYFMSGGFKVTKNYRNDSLKYRSNESIKSLKIAVGLIYGEMDEIIPPAEGQIIKDALKDKVEFKIMPYLNHDFSGEENQKEIIKTTLGWLKKWL